MCRKGFTFRDKFDVWFERLQSATPSVHRLGNAHVAGRRQANHVFSLFLKFLSFVRESYLVSLFSCSDCEKRTTTAENRLDSIVKDGSAKCILGILTEFRRRIEVVEAVTNSLAVKQCLLRTPKHRAFVECVLGSTSKQTSNSLFSVRLLKS